MLHNIFFSAEMSFFKVEMYGFWIYFTSTFSSSTAPATTPLESFSGI